MYKRTTCAVIAATTLLTLAGCSRDDGKSITQANKPTIIDQAAAQPPGTSSPSAPAAPTAAATSAAPSTPPAPKAAKVGDTITLSDGDGAPMDVTLVKLVDPASSTNQFTKPKAGMRFIAIQWKITNTGPAPIDDTPNYGSHVIDTDGQQFGSTYAETSAGPGFPSSVSIAPGGSRLGYVTYELPTESKIASIQLKSSAFRGVTGEWTN